MQGTAVLGTAKAHRNNSFRKCELAVPTPRCRYDSPEYFQWYHFSTSKSQHFHKMNRKEYSKKCPRKLFGFCFCFLLLLNVFSDTSATMALFEMSIISSFLIATGNLFQTNQKLSGYLVIIISIHQIFSYCSYQLTLPPVSDLRLLLWMFNNCASIACWGWLLLHQTPGLFFYC